MTNPTIPQPDAAEVAIVNEILDRHIGIAIDINYKEDDNAPFLSFRVDDNRIVYVEGKSIAAKAIVSHYHSIIQQKDDEIERLNKMYEVDMRILQKEKAFLSKGIRESTKIIEDKDAEIIDLKLQLKIYQTESK